MFSWTHKSEIRREDTCCTVQGSEGSFVKLQVCHGTEDQKWTHSKVNISIKKSPVIAICPTF